MGRDPENAAIRQRDEQIKTTPSPHTAKEGAFLLRSQVRAFEWITHAATTIAAALRHRSGARLWVSSRSRPAAPRKIGAIRICRAVNGTDE